ncbi:hypothetical protein PL75_06770 [Neisseria arctica]|uniref:Lipoprotein n=1 Tax=Neisseria arctica TaxID=1470200 RepID=A0A0J1C391_9NEIS|nr:DUF799 domain-containing protein [Neisseria arctica]KLT72773.1 hypothetical protein PL75_06770 [Neisseria arctica]UOO87271.1 DUF799 domain-containing protein [Neisseria arctica]
MNTLRICAAALAAALLAGCASQAVPHDYSAFKASNPRSILVLPPVNESPDVNAVNGFLSQTTLPLAEAGYYVFPVAVVQQTFRQNGLDHSADIHAVQLSKLHEIFGADAVLYLKVKQYGTSYKVLVSDTRVTADAILVDARSGQELWRGEATASSTENQSQQGLLVMLVQAAVQQIASNIGDKSYEIAGMTAQRLLNAGGSKGILYGPRSPFHWNQKQEK